MNRFFIQNLTGDVDDTVDIRRIAHQLKHVLRLQAGDEVVLLDDQGNEYRTVIELLEKSGAVGRIISRDLAHGEPKVALTLYQCALKGDRMEWVLQKGTELGVTAFVPVISERTIVRPASAIVRKYERWRTIIREAAEQSERGRIPALLEPKTWQQAVQNSVEFVRLIPWEEAVDAPSISSIFANRTSDGLADKSVGLMIGPEGGITADEITGAREVGWQPVTLGARILRAETATIASVTGVMISLGEMG